MGNNNNDNKNKNSFHSNNLTFFPLSHARHWTSTYTLSPLIHGTIPLMDITITAVFKMSKRIKRFKELAQGRRINKRQSPINIQFYLTPLRDSWPPLNICRVRLLSKVAYEVAPLLPLSSLTLENMNILCTTWVKTEVLSVITGEK